MGSSTTGEVLIEGEGDIVRARRKVRAISKELGFSLTDITRIITAASELARNIYLYANHGVMRWRKLERSSTIGLELVFADEGPGIPDIERAMQEGYSSRKGLGMGLPGSKRLMDELEITSEVGRGTVVTVRKWRG